MSEPRMLCPKCNCELNPMTMVGVTIDVCSICNGCWLDSKELAQLTRSRGSNAVEVQVVEKRTVPLVCPRCRKPTLFEGKHHHKPDFLIDECDKCRGIWLDRGELTTLLTTR